MKAITQSYEQNFSYMILCNFAGLWALCVESFLWIGGNFFGTEI